MLEKLQKKQENLTLKHENRQEHLKEFISWLNQNGVECPNIEIDSFEDEGLGLKAKAPIKVCCTRLSSSSFINYFSFIKGIRFDH